MSKENLKEQLDAIEKHLKWCIDNNKPQEQLDVHTGVISDIKQEIETKMSKEIIIEALIEASKWGSWAYESKWRERQGKTNPQDFKKWRRDVMEDIYNDYVNQNKDE